LKCELRETGCDRIAILMSTQIKKQRFPKKPRVGNRRRQSTVLGGGELGWTDVEVDEGNVGRMRSLAENT
jgi:hypothetical protein